MGSGHQPALEFTFDDIGSHLDLVAGIKIFQGQQTVNFVGTPIFIKQIDANNDVECDTFRRPDSDYTVKFQPIR